MLFVVTSNDRLSSRLLPEPPQRESPRPRARGDRRAPGEDVTNAEEADEFGRGIFFRRLFFGERGDDEEEPGGERAYERHGD